jgi:hypothetical protein
MARGASSMAQFPGRRKACNRLAKPSLLCLAPLDGEATTRRPERIMVQRGGREANPRKRAQTQCRASVGA